MPILIILAAAFLIYVLQELIYARFWDRNLHAEIGFTDRFIREGQTTDLNETVSNGKILPMPWVCIKFQLKRNGTVEHYRSDLYSLRFFQQIRRRIPFEGSKRGLITVRGLDLISDDLFVTRKFVRTSQSEASLFVYPKELDPEEYRIPYQKIMGDIVTKRFALEDPYMFRGLRDYDPRDGFKAINFKASARADKWLVNVHDSTLSQTVTILLNVETANDYFDPRLYENSIRMAAALIEAFEADGIPVRLVTNGPDALTRTVGSFETGCGSGHIHQLLEQLTRLDYASGVESFVPVIREQAETSGRDEISVLISPFFGSGCVSAYEELIGSHPDSRWILPVTASDLAEDGFKGKELAASLPGVWLWEVHS